jgi:hypothetical protein
VVSVTAGHHQGYRYQDCRCCRHILPIHFSFLLM